MLPARHRLRTGAEFAATVRGAGGARSGGRLVVVHARLRSSVRPAYDRSPSTSEPVRVGFVVSKAVGGAVTRNRTKRVLRHLVASRLSRIPVGIDLVVRANPAAVAATTAELGTELDRLLDRVLGKIAVVEPAGTNPDPALDRVVLDPTGARVLDSSGGRRPRPAEIGR